MRKSTRILELKSMTKSSDEMINLGRIIPSDDDIINLEQQVNGSMMRMINQQ